MEVNLVCRPHKQACFISWLTNKDIIATKEKLSKNEDTMETYYINSVKVNWGLAITSFSHVPIQEEHENKC